MVMHLQAGNLRAALDLMPSRIDLAAKGTPIVNIIKAIDPIKVEAFISFVLATEVAAMWNGDQRLNLQSHQRPVIAKSLMETFKSENLADFTLCFRRGVAGYYGELYRIDLSIINGWMAKYLEEKYQVIEDELHREKENQYRPIVPENSDRDWLGEWQKAIESGEGTRMATQLTQEQIEAEGQEKPKKDNYPATSRNEIELRLLHIEYIKANYDARTGQPLKTWIPEKDWIENL
jgi:hypothetical protein